MSFQKAGVNVLTRLPAVLLADDMGLGKTVQAIAAMSGLQSQGEVTRILVVAPAGLLGHWRKSLQQFAPDMTAIRIQGPATERAWQWRSNHTVHIAGYETVRGDLAVARLQPWDLVVLDEAQRIKNRDTGVSRACKRLPRRRAWALTGTPLENRVDDLASVLEFVRPNPEGVQLPSLQSGMSLMMRHQELQLRRRKWDVLKDLPPRLDVRLEVELTADQRSTYDRTLRQGRQEIIEKGDRATMVNVFEVLTRLKQICNFDPGSGSSSKLEDVAERMAQLDQAGHRALVFSQFTSDIFGVKRIADGLARFEPLTYTGTLGLTERDQVIERFKQDRSHRALVLSLRAGGNGLNLQTASYVFHFDRWWNPAVENQASDRAHRMGQMNAVTVYAYTTVGTIEERIENILAEKRALFANLVDGVSLDPTRILKPDEVFGLIDLKAPARLRDKAEPLPDDVVDLLARYLRGWGWQVIGTGERRGGGPVLIGRRLDELGLEETVWLYLMEAPSPSAMVALRADALEGVRVVVASTTPVEAGLASRASEAGVHLLEAQAIVATLPRL